MILGERELAWQTRVIDEAHRRGWTVYTQALTNQRQHAPSLVLIRERVLHVYLRTTVRRSHYAMVERMAQTTGVDTVLWSPRDWSSVVATLMHVGPYLSPASTLAVPADSPQ